MAVVFKGSGSVWIPECHRFVRFVNGEYATSDAGEIAVLAKKYGHDTVKENAPEIVADVPGREVDKPKRGRPSNGVRKTD